MADPVFLWMDREIQMMRKHAKYFQVPDLVVLDLPIVIGFAWAIWQ